MSRGGFFAGNVLDPGIGRVEERGREAIRPAVQRAIAQFEVVDVSPWCSTVLRVHNEDAAHEITKPRAKHRGAGGTGRGELRRVLWSQWSMAAAYDARNGRPTLVGDARRTIEAI